MLYRLTPPSRLEWTNFPAGSEILDTAIEHGADLDRLEWTPSEQRAFSSDMLRIALRHGIPTTRAIVLNAMHTVDLGRADELRANQQHLDERHGELRRSNAPLMESLMPGRTEHGEQLDDRVRASTERVAEDAEYGLAAVLAAPVDHQLASHWESLGGRLPS